jgi:ubiquitin-protein ligase
MRRIFVEATSGSRFEAEVPCGTKLSKLAADFYESQRWPLQDDRGRGQRAVVELVNPDNPDDTKRLNGDVDICEAGVQDGDTLRIFPESIAGAVDANARLTALIADHNDMRTLCERNPRITFTANRSHAPDEYTVTFHYTSFEELLPSSPEPSKRETHTVRIVLRDDYPRSAPIALWQTPIFHPNIRQSDGLVCLGALAENYLPGLGLAKVVTMLAEMVQWRNFDAFHPFNQTAADWAADPTHWKYILAIGGHPWQGPIEQILKQLDRARQPPIAFRRVRSG